MATASIVNNPGVTVWTNSETEIIREARDAEKTEYFFGTTATEPTSKGGYAIFGTRISEAIDTLKNW